MQEQEITQNEPVNKTKYAVVKGESVTELPKDLYIPPDALEVFLDAFEGPLDLLLYLIKKQNLDILDIPVAEITRQYMSYVEIMKTLNLELAAEYLVMAAMLAEIKSRMLLPRQTESYDDDDDPRAELVRRLQEYERFKKAAEDIDLLTRLHRDTYLVSAEPPELEVKVQPPTVDLKDLWYAFRDVMERAQMFADHSIEREILSTREKMAQILVALHEEKFSDFVALFDVIEGKMGVVVTFSAILELLRQSIIEIVQHEPYAALHVRKVA